MDFVFAGMGSRLPVDGRLVAAARGRLDQMAARVGEERDSPVAADFPDGRWRRDTPGGLAEEVDGPLGLVRFTCPVQ